MSTFKNIFLVLTLGVMSTGISSGAQARRGVAIDDGEIAVRLGTGCNLYLYGQPLSGRCDVGRAHGSRSSIIRAGGATYKISRYPGDKYSAEFFQVVGGHDRYIAEIEASGNCWIGNGVRFCAD